MYLPYSYSNEVILLNYKIISIYLFEDLRQNSSSCNIYINIEFKFEQSNVWLEELKEQVLRHIDDAYVSCPCESIVSLGRPNR